MSIIELVGLNIGVYREYVQNPVIATMSRNMSLLGQIFRTSKPFKINPLVSLFGEPFSGHLFVDLSRHGLL